MGKKIFFMDFDGTLLRDNKTISSEDVRTLEKLRCDGVYTVVATGRSLYSFEKALKAINMNSHSERLPVDYVIFSTGAGIYDYTNNKIIYKKNISSSKVQEITDCFDEFNYDYMVLKAIPDTRYFLYKCNGNDNPDFQSRLLLYKDYSEPLKKEYIHEHDATEVLAILPGGCEQQVLDEIRGALPGFSVIHATSPLDHQSAWIEVFHKDVSKSSTAEVFTDMFKVGRHNTISIGNDYNDQDLLEWTGKGFVVDNAPLYLKNKYAVVSSNNHAGVTMAAQLAGLI